MFARHHYLSGSLSAAAECYLATWNDEPVAFCALVGMYGKRGAKRITRLVVLPDYQGLGVGLRLAETVCRLQGERGVAVGITASHPAVIAHCRRSNLWRTVAVRKTGGRVEGNFFSRRGRPDTGRPKGSAGRAVVSFAFEGDAEGSSY